MQLRGVLPVAVTPFGQDDKVDHAALAHEVAWALEQGVDGLTVGMVSEYLRLSDEERVDVSRTTVAAAAGHPVVVSVGAESTVAACNFALRAEQNGAAALMAIPPISVRLSESEVAKYYEALINAVELPVIVQDASGYVGDALSIKVQVDLLKNFGSRVMFKPEADPIGQRLTALRDATRGEAQVFEGSGGIALVDSFRRGIAGTMPGTDLCWAIVALWRALSEDDLQTAYAISAPLSSLISMQRSLDTFIALEKHFLVRQKVLVSDRMRGPVGFVLDAETSDEADRVFDQLREAVASATRRVD